MFSGATFSVNRISARKFTIGQYLTTLLAAPVCALCQAGGQPFDSSCWGLDLCPACEAACPVLAHPCRRCAAPRPSATAPCEDCRLHPPRFDAAFALFQYADPVDQMIAALKFGHDLAFARIFGMLLARRLKSRQHPLPDCLLPLPLHRQRLLERGFNQSLEVARHLAPRCAIPVMPRLLRRARATAAQSTLSARERTDNLAGAFALGHCGRIPRHIALLDDVLTTGSTANAAADVLREAGAQHIEVWTCARAVRPV